MGMMMMGARLPGRLEAGVPLVDGCSLERYLARLRDLELYIGSAQQRGGRRLRSSRSWVVG